MRWYCLIESDAVEVLAAWRTDQRFEVAVRQNETWLRTESDEAGLLMNQWPGVVYREENGLLYEPMSSLARAKLPVDMSWQSLKAWWRLKVSNGLIAVSSVEKVKPRLVRGGAMRPALAMRTHIEHLYSYAMQVVAARLEPFCYACNGSGSVWIEGDKPLPMGGDRYILDGKVATPAGYRWEPRVDAEEIAKTLGVGKTMRAVFSIDGSWEMIPKESMIPMNRSSVKATYQSYRGTSAL